MYVSSSYKTIITLYYSPTWVYLKLIYQNQISINRFLDAQHLKPFPLLLFLQLVLVVFLKYISMLYQTSNLLNGENKNFTMPTESSCYICIIVIWMQSYNAIFIKGIVFVITSPCTFNFNCFKTWNTMC